jgi:hypothetical protein
VHTRLGPLFKRSRRPLLFALACGGPWLIHVDLLETRASSGSFEKTGLPRVCARLGRSPYQYQYRSLPGDAQPAGVRAAGAKGEEGSNVWNLALDAKWRSGRGGDQ